MPTSLTNYRGLQVVDPSPTGDGGLAIQNDLKSLVGWSPKSEWNKTSDPGNTDDSDHDYYQGSFWLRTDTNKLFVCVSDTPSSAIWAPVLLTLEDDSSPKLGGDLDVNGHKIIGAVEFGTSSTDSMTINGRTVTMTNGLTFIKTAESGVAENLYAWRVSDDPDSSLSIANGTSNASTFAPKFQAVQNGTAVSLNFNGQSTSGHDSGTSPYVLFVFSNANSPVSVRPGVEFRNLTSTLFQIMGDGSIKRFNATTRESDLVLATVNTTNATQTTAATFAIASGNTYLIEARITARRTGGSAGTAEDGASYVRRGTYTTKSGTVTLMGSVQTIGTDAEDQAAWDATLDISGSNVRVRVTGATNNNITWYVDATVQRVAS